MNDQLYNQTARDMGYCGRFKAWQMALMFVIGVLILFTALPALTYLMGMTWK